MDYFYVGNHANNVGLQDIYVKLKYKHEKYNVGADFHMFSTAADLLDSEELANTGNYTAVSAGLGTELDLYGGFNLSEGVALKLGYSQLFATDSMVELKGGDKGEMANWAYAMVVFNPQFLTGKKDKKPAGN